jgi:2-desacetyl-2-hydroxyethyl bacteriochlorophyllide A dehydrogenase
MNARCVLHTGVNEVAVREVEVREPGPGEVLIETLYSGISPGTELRCLRGRRPNNEGYPFIPGYTTIGHVLRRGPGVTSPDEGTLVIVGGTRHAVGVGLLWGGHVSHAVTPVERVVPIPPGVDPLDATVAKLAAIALRGVRLGAATIGERVAVIGLGVIGQLSARLHALAGARVVGADRSPARASRLVEAGVTGRVAEPGRPLREAFAADFPGGADVVVDCTGVADVLPDAIGVAREVPWVAEPPPGPRLVIQGSFEGAFTVPYQLAFARSLTLLLPRDMTRPDLLAVLDLIGRGKLRVRDLVSAVRPPDQAPQTYAELRDPTTTLLTAAFKWR